MDLFNEDQNKQTEESGEPKKNVMTEIGFGSNTRQSNPGAGMGDDREDTQSKPGGIGSWYDDRGPADDDAGPGFSKVNPEGKDPRPGPVPPASAPGGASPGTGSEYVTVDTNPVFFDIQQQKSTGRDSRPMRNKYTRELLERDPVKPSKRFDVDQLTLN